MECEKALRHRHFSHVLVFMPPHLFFRLANAHYPHPRPGAAATEQRLPARALKRRLRVLGNLTKEHLLLSKSSKLHTPTDNAAYNKITPLSRRNFQRSNFNGALKAIRHTLK